MEKVKKYTNGKPERQVKEQSYYIEEEPTEPKNKKKKNKKK